MHPRTAVVIPLHDGVVFVNALNGAERVGWFSEIAQPLDAITGSQFRVGTGGPVERGGLARSESLTAPACDKGGCGAVRSFGSRFFARDIVHSLPDAGLRLVNIDPSWDNWMLASDLRFAQRRHWLAAGVFGAWMGRRY